jgi:hypothetical protein
MVNIHYRVLAQQFNLRLRETQYVFYEKKKKKLMNVHGM